MAEIINLKEIDNSYFKKSKNVLVIGFFDGVHKGHKSIIKKCVNKALKLNGKSIALTFDNPPLNVITGKKEKKLIISLEKKIKIIDKLGIDHIVIVDFNSDFANLSAEDFCRQIIIEKLNASEIFVGENFRFGKGAKGDVNLLKMFFSNTPIKINIVKLLKINGTEISSTEIRKLYNEGDIEKIKLFLGRYPEINGKVVSGFKRGSKLGFPTANVELDENYIIPKNGVYFSKVSINSMKKLFPAVVNIGNNLTFGFRKTLMEVHIFDFNKNIYGENISIILMKYHRPELKFKSEAELAKQIASDIESGKDFFLHKRKK